MARMINPLTARLASERAPTIVAARIAFLDGQQKWGCPFRTTVGANTAILHVFQIATIDLTRKNWLERRMKSRVKPVRRHRNGIRIGTADNDSLAAGVTLRAEIHEPVCGIDHFEIVGLDLFCLGGHSGARDGLCIRRRPEHNARSRRAVTTRGMFIDGRDYSRCSPRTRNHFLGDDRGGARSLCPSIQAPARLHSRFCFRRTDQRAGN
jgi:hypothetical protein